MRGGQIGGLNRKESLKPRREETGHMNRGPSTSVPSKGLGVTRPCTGPLRMSKNGQKNGHLNSAAPKSLQ